MSSCWYPGLQSPNVCIHQDYGPSCFRIKKKLRGRVSGDLMHAVDWYNTILGMTGRDGDDGDHDDGGDGHNMWATIAEGKPGPRTELVYNINDALR